MHFYPFFTDILSRSALFQYIIAFATSSYDDLNCSFLCILPADGSGQLMDVHVVHR